MDEKFLAGKYGGYELVYASDEAIDAYEEACLESISEDEMYEAWQLYHLSVLDLLNKVFAAVRQGKCEAYFLLCHNSDEEKTEVVGIGGFGALSAVEAGAHVGVAADKNTGSAFDGKTGEIWFMGQSLACHKRFVVRYGREIIAKILTHYPLLINAAAVWNSQALQLVKFLGFTVGEKAVCMGMDNSLFKYFYITRE